MHTRSITLSRHLFAACALGACLAGPAALAAGAGAAPSNADIEARYRTDVARCNTGQTNQDKATCLREAGAARDESRRHRLSNGDQAYDKNEVARCQALPMDKRDDCMLQMSGHNTTTQGSVGGGGVLRETTITVPGTPAPGTVPAPAPGLTPNPPPAVPAPSLAPTPPVLTPAPSALPAQPVPGTGVVK